MANLDDNAYSRTVKEVHKSLMHGDVTDHNKTYIQLPTELRGIKLAKVVEKTCDTNPRLKQND